MKSDIPFFNWSLHKVLVGESDSLVKAKYKILYVVLILAILKGLVAMLTAAYFEQYFQLLRGSLYFTLFISLFKLFLNQLLKFKTIAHIVLVGTIILVCTNIFVTARSINVATLQFIFVIILSSFYILNDRMGLIYSVLAIIPIIISLFIGYKFDVSADITSLRSPGYEIIILLNFVTIVYIPYLFYQAFLSTLNEKESLNIQLQSAVKTANEAVRSKGDFLSTMSHELRTPLNTVIGTTNLLLSDPYQDHQAENLKDLKFSTNCLVNIVDDILIYNKLESDKLSLERIHVDLSSLLSKVCSSLATQANEKHIGLKLDVAKGIAGIEVFTDPTRITQIIYNLMGNAIKFTSKGEVRLKLTVLKKQKKHILIRFAVEDTGIGINKEQLVVIFEPFSQASTSITRNFGGTGLGLSIVKRLLALFDSDIHVESAEQQGSTFYFDINFKYQLQSKKPTASSNLAKAIEQDISDLKILVAEDNLMNRTLMQRVLERWNNVPVFAENGRQAIEIATSTKFDVILMDLHMPEVDGYAAAKVIKLSENNVNKATPIIAFTASISDTILEEIKACGMGDYIYKPFDATTMYDKIRNLYPHNIST